MDSGSPARLCLGDHGCLVVDDDVTLADSLATYIRVGRDARHRILYYGDHVERVKEDLATRGVDPEAALAAGQLQMSSPEATCLASGAFDPEAAIEGWQTETERALADGYLGLKAIGDMSWASRPVPGAERLEWCEAQVNRVFAGGFAMALCTYDHRLFEHSDLARVARSHPAALETDPDTVPLLRAVRTSEPPGLRLQGDGPFQSTCSAYFDGASRRRHARHRSAPHRGPVELRFADMTAVQIMTRAAGSQRLHVVGCSSSLRRLFTYNCADAVPGLNIEAAA